MGNLLTRREHGGRRSGQTRRDSVDANWFVGERRDARGQRRCFAINRSRIPKSNFSKMKNDPGTSGVVPGSSSLSTRAYLLDMSACFVQLGGLVSASCVPMFLMQFLAPEIDFATQQNH
jgi:hypothetical protein